MGEEAFYSILYYSSYYLLTNIGAPFGTLDALHGSFAYLIFGSRHPLASPDVPRELHNAGELEASGTLRIYQMLLESLAVRDHPSAYRYYLVRYPALSFW